MGGAVPRPGEGSVLLPCGQGIPGEVPPQHQWRPVTPSPPQGWDCSPAIAFLASAHSRREHRCEHQVPSRVPVPEVSSMVQLGVHVAGQPVSHHWVSMVMEQEP